MRLTMNHKVVDSTRIVVVLIKTSKPRTSFVGEDSITCTNPSWSNLLDGRMNVHI